MNCESFASHEVSVLFRNPMELTDSFRHQRVYSVSLKDRDSEGITGTHKALVSQQNVNINLKLVSVPEII